MSSAEINPSAEVDPNADTSHLPRRSRSSLVIGMFIVTALVHLLNSTVDHFAPNHLVNVIVAAVAGVTLLIYGANTTLAFAAGLRHWSRPFGGRNFTDLLASAARVHGAHVVRRLVIGLIAGIVAMTIATSLTAPSVWLFH